MQRKVKECDEEYAKTKQDLLQACQSKQQFVRKLKEDIENQRRKNE